jgi:hypothetical protein
LQNIILCVVEMRWVFLPPVKHNIFLLNSKHCFTKACLQACSTEQGMSVLQNTSLSLLWVWILTGTLNSFMWGSYSASLQNVGGSTQVPVCAWNNAWKDTWGLLPPDRTIWLILWGIKSNQTNLTEHNVHYWYSWTKYFYMCIYM